MKTIDGSIAEIVKETAGGSWNLLRYVEASDDENLVGTEDLCEDELQEVVVTS